MRLIARDTIINSLPSKDIFDTNGSALVTPLQIEYFNLGNIAISSFFYDSKRRKYRIEFTNTQEISVGDNIKLYDGEFYIDVVIATVSTDKRIAYLSQDYKSDFIVDESSITECKLQPKFLIVKAEVEEGIYYTNYGEAILIADKFNYEQLVTISDIRLVYPILRENRATEDWELVGLRQIAYEKIMERLAVNEKEFLDRYKYINGTSIRFMILKQIAIIYRETLPNETLIQDEILIKLENDLNQLFRNLTQVLSVREDATVKEEREDLTLLRY